MDIPPTEAASPLKRGRFVNTYRRSPTTARLTLEGECFCLVVVSSLDIELRIPHLKRRPIIRQREQVKVAQQSPRLMRMQKRLVPTYLLTLMFDLLRY